MDEGKMPLFNQVSSKDFLGTLINILKTRGSPLTQEKILYLLKKWGIKFEKNKDILPSFTDLYEQLKKNNTVFPNIINPPYRKYVNLNLSNNEEIENNFNNKNNNNQKIGLNLNNNNNNSEKKPEKNLQKKSSSKNYDEDLNAKKEKTSNYDYKNYIDLNINKFNKKYKKYVEELVIWMDNITLANVKN
jgi:hypothetical protein